MFKLRLITIAALFLLGFSGVAFAATGQLPAVASGVAALAGFSGSGDGAAGSQYLPADAENEGNVEADDQGSASEDQYGNHEERGVSEVARDKDATETMELPNGHEVENHGLAVRKAAHEIHDEKMENHREDGEMTPPTTMPGPPAQMLDLTGEPGERGKGSVQHTAKNRAADENEGAGHGHRR
jgi:hypothetical protein